MRLTWALVGVVALFPALCRAWVTPLSANQLLGRSRVAVHLRINSRATRCVKAQRGFLGCVAQADKADDVGETLLTNEQCEILELPYGTKIVGEMDEFMVERLTKRGTYEGSAQLRYFGNEKFRKKNYFGKQKLEVNKKRSAAKFRRAEIEARMDRGIKYDVAVKQVDAELAAGTLDPFGEDVEEQEAMGSTAGKGKIEWGAGGGADTSVPSSLGGNRLPPGWQSAIDPSTGSTYYYNDRGATQWELPV